MRIYSSRLLFPDPRWVARSVCASVWGILLTNRTNTTCPNSHEVAGKLTALFLVPAFVACSSDAPSEEANFAQPATHAVGQALGDDDILEGATEELRWIFEHLTPGVTGNPPVQVEVRTSRTDDVELDESSGITVENVRGLTWSSAAPVLSGPPVCDSRLTDGFAPGTEPYVAEGIEPFAFQYLHNEFNYGGEPNATMREYAATHGFSRMFAYRYGRDIDTTCDGNEDSVDTYSNLPAGTTLTHWTGVDWASLLTSSGVGSNDFQALTPPGPLNVDALVAPVTEYPNPSAPPTLSHMMVDIEHGVSSFASEDYYRGQEAAYISSVNALRADAVAAGVSVPTLGIYGWVPKAEYFAQAYQWNRELWDTYTPSWFGQAVFDAIDVLHPDMYQPYPWRYTQGAALAHLDDQRDYVAEHGPKGLEPYQWAQYHGGGGGFRYWRSLPIETEYVRAQRLLTLFSQVDGLVEWNWTSAGDNYHVVPEIVPCQDFSVKDGFSANCVANCSASDTEFDRYDTIHVVELNGDKARFQRSTQISEFNPTCAPDTQPEVSDLLDSQPIYQKPATNLSLHLRETSSAMAGVFEGLAMAKLFEYFIEYGEPVMLTEGDPRANFMGGLRERPILRQLKVGDYRILASWNPAGIFPAPGQEVQWLDIPDFDGSGRTVRIMTDAEVRIHVLKMVSEMRYEFESASELDDFVFSGAQGQWVWTGLKLQQRARVGANMAIAPNYVTEACVETRVKTNSVNWAGVVFRYQDSNNYYRFILSPRHDSARFQRVKNGAITTLASRTWNGDWTTNPKVKVCFSEDPANQLLRGYIDGTEVISATDQAVLGGRTGLFNQYNKGAAYAYLRINYYAE